MKSMNCLLMAALLASPLACVSAAETHGHDAAAHTLHLDAGKKWATDAPLRQAMTTIRTATQKVLPLVHAGKAGDADYAAFAGAVNAQLAFIVQNCKLDPKADAQLHVIIGELAAAVAQAQQQLPGQKRKAGVVKVVQALNSYGRFFEQPDWKPIAPAH